MQAIDFLQANGNLLLVNLLIQITVLAGLALLIASRFKRNAAARYGVLYPALLALVLLVTVSTLLNVSGKLMIQVPLPSVAAAERLVDGAEFQHESPPGLALDLMPQDFMVDQSTGTSRVASEQSDGAFSMLNLPYYLLFALLWVAGLTLATLGLLRSFHHVDRLTRHSNPPSLAERQRLELALQTLPIAPSQLHIRISGGVGSPILAGLFKPVLLLPVDFITALDPKQLRGVILHEYAHFRRQDGLANFLQKVLVALFWFHPLVHVMDRQITRAREEICDNHVLNSEPAVNYGETLLRVSTLSNQRQLARRDQALAMGMFGGEWRLESRIGELLSDSRQTSLSLPQKTRYLRSLAVLLTVSALAACQIGTAERTAGPTVSSSPEPQSAPEPVGESTFAPAPQPDTGANTPQPNSAPEALVADNDALEQQLRDLELRSRYEEEQLRQRQRELEQQLRFLEEEVRRREQEVEAQASAVEQENRQRQAALEDQARRLEQDERQRQAELEERRRQLEQQLRQQLDPPSDAQPQQQSAPLRTAPRYLQVQSTQAGQSRPPPQARTANTLSQEVMEAIDNIQTLLSPEEEGAEPDLPGAKAALDSLRAARFETMNDFERSTLLNFYTNYHLMLQDYEQAILSFEEILTIENLREDIRLRTLRSLGQLYAAQTRWQESIDNYTDWREQSEQEDDVVYRGLSYGHYQLEEFSPAVDYWQDYMTLQEAEGTDLDRDDYAYLNGLYFTLERFDEALELTKEMILLFNSPTDWDNLRAIYRNLDAQEEAAQAEQELLGALADQQREPQIRQASLSATDGDYLPLVSLIPQYPTRAAQQGIEGWCLLSFTVDLDGQVVEDSITVLDAEPPNIFNRASIRAAAQFKFQPRVENGASVAVPGVQYLFRYALDDEDA